jgi:hypothetical protein
MYKRMGDVALGVIELKLLTHINGEITARELSPVLGLPLYDVYELLVKLAREGIIAAPAGAEALAGLQLSVEESMQAAFSVLDANDDAKVRLDVLDRVLGSADEQQDAGQPARRGPLFSGLFDDAANAKGNPKGKPKPKAEDADPGDDDEDAGGLLSMLRRPRRGPR